MYRHMCVVLEKREKERGKRIKRGRRGSERKGEAERRESERVVNRLNQHKRWRTNKKKTVIYLLKHKATSVAGEGRQTH